MKKYVLVGSGPAGVAAAEAIREHDPQGKIILVGEETEGYYSRPGLAYYLTGEIPEAQLFPYSREEFNHLGIDWLNARVTQIDPDAQKAHLDNGIILNYDELLLATGAAARKSNLPGAELPGVMQLDTLADARGIIRRARKARTAVVIGGGITALEIVEGLLALNVRVHYFLRGERYWGSVLDESESRIVEHLLQEEGVHIHYHTEAAEILPVRKGWFGRGREQVGGVVTKTGEHIRCDMVAIAIGVVPRVRLAKEARLDVDRGVLVDEGMRTSRPNIYAAGDIAQAYDPLAGRAILDVLWPVARDQGRVAGTNMAGGHAVYRKETPLNVTRLAGTTTTIIGAVSLGGQDLDIHGVVRGDSETWRTIPDALVAQQGFEVNRIRLMVAEHRIVGAIVMGDQTLSRPIYNLIRDEVDITPIRDRLLNDPHVGDVLAEFYSALFLQPVKVEK